MIGSSARLPETEAYSQPEGSTSDAVDSPLRVAVTGGIACGKSSVGRFLSRHGVAVWDADEAARTLTARGSPVLETLFSEFGTGVQRPDGGLDRLGLARRVFSDSEALARLNAILHPPILERCRSWVQETTRRGQHAAALIPLLFEIRMPDLDRWDATVCVSDSRDRIMARLLERGLTPEEAAQRMAAQLPLPEKERLSDYVIVNQDGLAELERETLAVWRRILQKGR